MDLFQILVCIMDVVFVAVAVAAVVKEISKYFAKHTLKIICALKGAETLHWGVGAGWNTKENTI